MWKRAVVSSAANSPEALMGVVHQSRVAQRCVRDAKSRVEMSKPMASTDAFVQ